MQIVKVSARLFYEVIEGTFDFKRKLPMKKLKLSPLMSCIVSSGMAAAMLVIPNVASASNYMLQNFFYSAVAAGEAGADGAALAIDASTAYSNPAGLVRIKNPQLVIVNSGLSVNTQFRGSNTWHNSSPLLASPFLNTFTQTGSADGSVFEYLPAAHFSIPIGPCWRFAFSGAPIAGLHTDYGYSSITRYNTTNTKLVVLDLSPTIAYQIDQNWSVGLGADFARASVAFRAVAGLPTFGANGAPNFAATPTALDTFSTNNGTGWGYGGHIGVMYQMTPGTRFGLTYRSKINIDVSGSSSLNGPIAVFSPRLPPALPLIPGSQTNNTFDTVVILPPVTSIGGHHDITPCWGVDGTVYYTQWNQVNHGNQILRNIITPFGPVNASIPWSYVNTWTAAIGTSYQVSRAWALRTGVGYDQTPVKPDQRLLAIPDNNRWYGSIGTHWQYDRNLGFDAGYTHVWVQDATEIAPTTIGLQTSTPTGKSYTHGDIVSVQVNWNFV